MRFVIAIEASFAIEAKDKEEANKIAEQNAAIIKALPQFKDAIAVESVGVIRTER